MAKRGSPKHMKRLAVPKVVNINNKKQFVFALNTNPGPHPKSDSVPLGILLRDILNIASSMKEVKTILNSNAVLVDNKVVKDPKYPIGFMDIVKIKDFGKFLISVDNKGRLKPIPSDEDIKYAKVVNKYTIKKGKLMAMLHDGKNFGVDNSVKVGDTLVVSLSENKIIKHLPFKPGSLCFIYKGKHSGKLAELVNLIHRPGKDAEAELKDDSGNFITVAKYLIVVDNSFKGE